MFLLGGLDDQLPLLIWSIISQSIFSITTPLLADSIIYQEYFSNLINPLTSNQPLIWAIYSVLLSLFGKNMLNILSVLTLLLNLAVSYVYFKKYSYPLVYTLLFVFSTYTYLHFGKHSDLSQIWTIPLFFLVLENMQDGVRKNIYLGLLLALATFISNYIAFFLLVTFSILVIINIVVNKFSIAEIKNKLTHWLITMTVFFLCTSTVLFPFFKSNYLMNNSTSDIKKVDRSLSDMFTFSSRPWYFLLPPVQNPLFGNFSKDILTRIGSYEYFLLDDYFSGEHPENYFGLFLLGSFLVLNIYIYKKNKHYFYKNNLSYLLILIIIFLFMMPPFFTIGGVTIYTPGYLLYLFFKIFRVTSRFGIILLFLILGIYANNMTYLFKNSVINSKVLKIFLSVLLVITLVETYIPIKIYTFANKPEIYDYIENSTTKDSRYAIYPYSHTDDGFVWMSLMQRVLVNPRGYYGSGYDSDKFTNGLNDLNLAGELAYFEIDYILVFNDIKNDIFKNSEKLVLEKEFIEGSLFKVVK